MGRSAGAMALMLAGVLAGARECRAQAWMTYDATSGTLPSQQCWTYQGTVSPTISGGVIDFGPSAMNETRYYVRSDLTGVDFAQTVVIETEVFVASGAYSANPCGTGQRSAVGFAIADSQGRLAKVGLGSDRVFIATQNNPPANASNPSVDWAMGGGWRVVRMTISNFAVSVTIDGTPALSVNLGAAYPTGQAVPGQAYFGGDTTVCLGGQGLFKSFRMTATPTAGGGGGIIIDPVGGTQLVCPGGAVHLSISAAAPLTMGFRWHRNGVPLSDGPTGTGSIVNGSENDVLELQGVSGQDVGLYSCQVTTGCGTKWSGTIPISLTGQKCQPADIAFDNGLPLSPCVSMPNTGVNEGDFNAFFMGFFDATPPCDIADDQGNAPPVVGIPNGGVNEGDYNAFFMLFFNGCG